MVCSFNEMVTNEVSAVDLEWVQSTTADETFSGIILAHIMRSQLGDSRGKLRPVSAVTKFDRRDQVKL